MKIRPLEAEICVDGRTDRTKLIALFAILRTPLKMSAPKLYSLLFRRGVKDIFTFVCIKIRI